MPHERLSPLDGSFLRVESGAAHMHVAWKGRFRPRRDGRPVTLEALRASVSGRLRHAPRFRRRLAFPPGGLSEPVWVDDERFDIAHHVTALSAADEAVSDARFAALADRVLSLPLDRTRALWAIHLVPRLADGSVGIVMKVHHAMVDGKSAVALAILLLDADPAAEPLSAASGAEAWAPAAAPGAARLALEAMAEAGGESLRAASGLARLAASPARGVRLVGTLRRAALAVSEDVLRAAPASYLNVPIGTRRTLVHHTADLAPLLEVKRRRAATLNDVALAVVAGALRALALAHGRAPEPLKVMVPVNTRRPDEASDLGNRIAFVFVELPLQLFRPLARLEAVKAATRAFKAQERAAGGEAVLQATGFLPGPLKGLAARLAASPRMYNLVASNVPGPRVPVFLLGAELVEAFPVIPISDGHALSIGMLTYRERICFGAYADPVALPEVRELPGALERSVRELERAANAAGGSAPRRRAPRGRPGARPPVAAAP